MIVGFAIASVSVVPMRLQSSHKSEQISQLLFGEKMIVLSKKKGEWLYVVCEWDSYEGWVKAEQVTFISERTYRRKLTSFSSFPTDAIVLPDGQFQLSPGSSLFLLKGKKFLWNNDYHFKGKKTICKDIVFDPIRLTALAKLFLGSPYHWGGRSIMGIDCSGFSQVIFKLFNHKLPRDAYLQALVGESVDFLQESKCGDLAFFDNEEGVITHVGILLNNHTIIHATDTSGCVVIDAIDNSGIISKSKKMRTHNLRLVKRYFSIKDNNEQDPISKHKA